MENTKNTDYTKHELGHFRVGMCVVPMNKTFGSVMSQSPVISELQELDHDHLYVSSIDKINNVVYAVIGDEDSTSGGFNPSDLKIVSGMELEDIEVGMKVIPFRKTAFGHPKGLQSSSVWMGCVKRDKPYLYVVAIKNDGVLLLNDRIWDDGAPSGDNFTPSDVIPYVGIDVNDLRIGDKVIPFQKTLCNIPKLPLWYASRQWRERSEAYLYVVQINISSRVITLSNDKTTVLNENSDIFHIDDFIMYKESEEKMYQIKDEEELKKVVIDYRERMRYNSACKNATIPHIAKMNKQIGVAVIESIKRNAETIKYVRPNVFTEEMCKIAVGCDGMLLRYVPSRYRTDEVIDIAVKNVPNAITFLPNSPSPNNRKVVDSAILKALDQDGLLLRFLDKPTYDQCIRAVIQNANVLQYIADQTPEIVLCALNNDSVDPRESSALQYVKLFDEEIVTTVKMTMKQINEKLGVNVEVVEEV